jgi:uncharacterized membrane protein YkvA (DUF1232 family)
MNELIEKWKQQARQLKLEVYALYLAYQDPRVSWISRVVVACVVGYALSPIDLIPDFIPVIGYLDDLILIPLGITLALSMIPESVMNESREKAREMLGQDRPVNWMAAIVIILVWISFVIFAAVLIMRMFSKVRLFH